MENLDRNIDRYIDCDSNLAINVIVKLSHHRSGYCFGRRF